MGGASLCVSGMEAPGGYHLVGRTVPVWRTPPPAQPPPADPPWLLRLFDVLRFHPVSPTDLLDLRADVAAGRREPPARPVKLRLADLLPTGGPAAAAFTERRRAAFAEERDRWALAEPTGTRSARAHKAPPGSRPSDSVATLPRSRPTAGGGA